MCLCYVFWYFLASSIFFDKVEVLYTQKYSTRLTPVLYADDQYLLEYYFDTN